MSEQLSEQNPMIVTSFFQEYAIKFKVASDDMKDVDFVLGDCRSKLITLMNDSSLKTRAQMDKWQKDIEKCESVIETLEAKRRDLLTPKPLVPHDVPDDFVF